MCMFLSCMFWSNLCQTEGIQDACNICDSYACYVRREVYVEGTHGGMNMSTLQFCVCAGSGAVTC